MAGGGQIGAHQRGEQMGRDGTQRIGAVAAGLAGALDADEAGHQAAGDLPQIERGHQHALFPPQHLCRVEERLGVAGMTVDDDDPGQVVARQTVENIGQHGAERGLRQRDPARHGAEEIRAAIGQHRRHQRADTALRGAFGDAFGHALGGQVIAHRRVRPLILETAKRQQDHRVSGQSFAHFPGGQFAHAVFGHACHPECAINPARGVIPTDSTPDIPCTPPSWAGPTGPSPRAPCRERSPGQAGG